MDMPRGVIALHASIPTYALSDTLGFEMRAGPSVLLGRVPNLPSGGGDGHCVGDEGLSAVPRDPGDAGGVEGITVGTSFTFTFSGGFVRCVVSGLAGSTAVLSDISCRTQYLRLLLLLVVDEDDLSG